MLKLIKNNLKNRYYFLGLKEDKLTKHLGTLFCSLENTKAVDILHVKLLYSYMYTYFQIQDNKTINNLMKIKIVQ